MEPEVITGRGYIVETSSGTFVVPRAVVEMVGRTAKSPSKKDFLKYAPEVISPRAFVERVREVKGYFARMSAPGYLDATDWEYLSNKRFLRLWEIENTEDDDEDVEGLYDNEEG